MRVLNSCVVLLTSEGNVQLYKMNTINNKWLGKWQHRITHNMHEWKQFSHIHFTLLQSSQKAWEKQTKKIQSILPKLLCPIKFKLESNAWSRQSQHCNYNYLPTRRQAVISLCKQAATQRLPIRLKLVIPEVFRLITGINNRQRQQFVKLLISNWEMAPAVDGGRWRWDSYHIYHSADHYKTKGAVVRQLGLCRKMMSVAPAAVNTNNDKSWYTTLCSSHLQDISVHSNTASATLAKHCTYNFWLE